LIFDVALATANLKLVCQKKPLFRHNSLLLKHVEGEGHSKKLTFFVFPLTEVSASEVPTILKKFASKEATSEVAIYVTSLRPTRNWWEGEKPAILTCILHKVCKVYFFQAIIHFTT